MEYRRPTPYLSQSNWGLWLLVGAMAAAGCQPSDRPTVAFGSATAVGRWQPDPSAGSGASTQAGVGGPSAGFGAAGMGAPAAGTGVAAAGSSGAAGTGFAGVDAGAGTGNAGAGNAGMGSAGVGGAGAGGAGAGGTGSTGLSALTFNVLTHTQNGQFAPRNVGAIWIENSSGGFVKTLAIWARQRLNHLNKFNAEAGANNVDAVTSATLPDHVTHMVTWNLKDLNGSVVPDGDYKVVVECTDRNSPAGAFDTISFTKGPTRPMPQTIAVPDATYFTGMSITLQ